MRCVHWLLLGAILSTGQATGAARSVASILELEQILLASPQLQGGRRLLNDDLFEDHAARYLVAAADTIEEATALFKLYKKLYPKQVSAWGSTEAKQFAYFELNVFPRIQDKADKLLSGSNAGLDDSNTTEDSDSTNGDKTASGKTSATSTGKNDDTNDDDSTTTSDDTSTNDGTTIAGGGTSSGGRGGTSTSGRGGTSTGGDTSTAGGTSNGGGTPANGGRSDGGRGGTSGGGGTSSGGGTSTSGGGTSGTTGGTSNGAGTSGNGGGTSGTGGGTGGGTSGTGGGTSNGDGTSGNGGRSDGGRGGTSGGGGTSTSGGGTSGTGGGTSGHSPTSNGSPSSGGTGGTSASDGTSPSSSSRAFTAISKTPSSTASGSSFWSTTYNAQLSSNVNSLSPQTGTLETVVQSSSADGSSVPSATSQYTSPTVISGYSSPSRRFLTSGSSDTSNVDVLFCDIEGNAIWKWSAEDVPDATVTNSSSSVTEIDVTVDGVCSATTTLTVSAYQSGCSLQNHPEGCENVYYKGCGGITVSPTSNRIVIARTGGRTLGVLNYKSVDDACQGQIVDAITTYRGRKFNSPTYAEFANNGNLYFTDSPFGLATSDADFDGDTLDKSPLREIPFNGVYMLRHGTNQSVELVDCDMTRPNKIAFSPAQDLMYITNSQKGNSYVKRYVLADDGTVSNSSVFFNFTAHPELKTNAGFAKGIKVDDNGYVYVVCYKGVYIFSPKAELAGAIMSSEELDSVSMGLGRLFISGAFGLVAQTSGVPSQRLPQAQVTCSA